MKLESVTRMKLFIAVFSVTIWLALYPGYYSDDSLNTIQELHQRTFNGIQGTIWNLHIFLTSAGGVFPELTTLIGLLILNYTILFFCKEYFSKNSNLIASLVILLPNVWSFGVTLWHDVSFCAGVLIMLSLIRRLDSSQENWIKKNFIYWILAYYLVMTRLNGVFLCLIVTTYFVLKIKWSRSLLYILPVFLLVCLLPFTWNLVQPERGANVIASGQYFARADISCIASQNPKLLNKYLSQMEILEWKSNSACTWFNTSEAENQNKGAYLSKIPKLYLTLMMDHPEQLLKIHWQRHEYLLNPIKAFTNPAPFIHSKNAWNGRTGLLGDHVYGTFNSLSRLSNYTRGVTANHPVFFLLVLITYIFKKRNLKYCFAFLSMIIAMMFVIAPHPDTRFVFPTILIGYILSTYWFFQLNYRFHPFNLFLETKSKIV